METQTVYLLLVILKSVLADIYTLHYSVFKVISLFTSSLYLPGAVRKQTNLFRLKLFKEMENNIQDVAMVC